ncbi:integrase [Gossypium australe]|uniref:Integrase n=1 Tax=Gossypium australe TaxID=47621 RepID=A0A5B6WDL0_9ROSI|nr:integrase [Gossypium australe]
MSYKLNEYRSLSIEGFRACIEIFTRLLTWYYSGMKCGISEIVFKCLICQQDKVEHQVLISSKLLQPVMIPK